MLWHLATQAIYSGQKLTGFKQASGPHVLVLGPSTSLVLAAKNTPYSFSLGNRAKFKVTCHIPPQLHRLLVLTAAKLQLGPSAL